MKLEIIGGLVFAGIVVGLPTTMFYVTKTDVTARVVKAVETGDYAYTQVIHLDTGEILSNGNVPFWKHNSQQLKSKVVEGRVCKFTVASMGDPREPRRTVYDVDCDIPQPEDSAADEAEPTEIIAQVEKSAESLFEADTQLILLDTGEILSGSLDLQEIQDGAACRLMVSDTKNPDIFTTARKVLAADCSIFQWSI